MREKATKSTGSEIKYEQMNGQKLFRAICRALCEDREEQLALYNALAGTEETDAEAVSLTEKSGGFWLSKAGGADFVFSSENYPVTEQPEKVG